ncbi:MAG: hypothetical protein EA427_02340 [Spirochaetaceae bacterium]|nr:MAG: hypothetical protein EA427_02340 [Spirochaetaceae bacterium]
MDRTGLNAGGLSRALLLVLLVLISGCSGPGRSADKLPLRIAIPRQPSSALALLAMEGGFFEAEGLAPRYTIHPSGKRALEEALLAGTADIALASDLPVLEHLSRGEDLLILATVQSVRSLNAVVGNRDRGIGQFADLREKRVGLQPHSAVHYFLECALVAHDVDIRTVEIHAMPIEELVPALVRGDVDAVSIREPYLTDAVHRLGSRSVVLRAPWVYPQFDLALVRRSFAENHAPELELFLRALLRAEQFLRTNPDEAALMVARTLNLGVEETGENLSNAITRVELPQSMILHFEEQLRWIREEGTDPVRTPLALDLLEIIHPGPLRAIQPERVDIAGFAYWEPRE